MTTEIESQTDIISLNLNSKSLLNALLALGKVVSANPIVPSIENVHVTVSPGQLKLRATDLLTTLTTVVNFATEIGEKYEGVFLIPHKLTMDLLKSLPDVPVLLCHENSLENFKITFRIDKQKYALQTENPKDFPKEQKVIGETLSLPADQIKEGLKICLNSVGTDDLRPQMQGIYFDSDTTNLTLASTNGHHIVRYQTKVLNESKLNFILRSGAANAIADAIEPTTKFIELTVSDKLVMINLGNITISSQLIDERYPDYKSAVPQEFPNVANLNLNDWKTLIKRSLLFSNKTTSAIRCHFIDDKLRVSSEDLDFQTQSDQEIEIDGTFENTAIGLNGKYLISSTQSISGDIVLRFSTPNRMIDIDVPDTLAESLHIGLMPVFLAENA